MVETGKMVNKSFFESTLQTVAVTYYMGFLLTGAIAGWAIWFVIFYIFPLLRIPLLIYVGWIYYDRHSIETGNRRWEALRESTFWKYHNNYFPVEVVKTAELPPDKNYLFCTFPHGILATGCTCAFANNCNNFGKVFPGLKPWMTTLVQHFHTPFFREYAMLIGSLPASASCLTSKLKCKEKGNVLVLLVGGAQEAFYCEPGNYTIYIKSRKGFVKIALKTGTPLVPVVVFNEPDLFKQVHFEKNTLCFKVQMLIKRATNLAPTIFYGRFSFMPFKKPLYIVVGEPIYVDQVNEPTNEELDELHAKFTKKLVELFEKEKHKYIENADKTHLNII